jgi:glutamine amidotransferase
MSYVMRPGGIKLNYCGRCCLLFTLSTPPITMCRWFCLVSTENCLLEDMLILPKHSLIKQSEPQHHAPRKLTAVDDHYLPDIHIEFQASDDSSSPNVITNIDGYGIAYWTTAACTFNPDTCFAGPDDPHCSHRDMMRPVMYKSTRPPLNDLNLRSLARGTSSKGLLAHIRAGTVRPTLMGF